MCALHKESKEKVWRKCNVCLSYRRKWWQVSKSRHDSQRQSNSYTCGMQRHRYTPTQCFFFLPGGKEAVTPQPPIRLFVNPRSSPSFPVIPRDRLAGSDSSLCRLSLPHVEYKLKCNWNLLFVIAVEHTALWAVLEHTYLLTPQRREKGVK